MIILTAKTEMEMYTDLFNKISSSCYQKCASRKHHDQDLSLGEMTCTGTLSSSMSLRYLVQWAGLLNGSHATLLPSTIRYSHIFPFTTTFLTRPMRVQILGQPATHWRRPSQGQRGTTTTNGTNAKTIWKLVQEKFNWGVWFVCVLLARSRDAQGSKRNVLFSSNS